MMLTRTLLITLLCMLAMACKTTGTANNNTNNNTNRVLIITSNGDVPRYKTAQQAFQGTMADIPVTQLDLKNDKHPTETLQDLLNRNQFDVIYAIGAKALGSVDHIAPNAPVVYSSVLSWRQFEKRAHYYGVASEVSPQAQLAWFKHFFPAVSRMSILYSEMNVALIKEARETAKYMGIELNAIQIEDSADVQQKLAFATQNTDLLWIMPDSLVLHSEQTILDIFKAAHQASLPVAAYSAFYMDLGATITINADTATTGRQAALLVQKLLDKNTTNPGIQYPAGSSISLSMGKVERYQINLNLEALSEVNDLIEE